MPTGTVRARIKSIKPAGSTTTYDIGVKKNHNFFANDVLVHNCQHDAASSMSHLHNQIEPDFILGMTATPFRTDRMKLCFNSIIKDVGIHQLIQDGFLSPYHHYTIPEWTPLEVANHYCADPERWGKSIFFFVNLGECDELAAIFRERGVNHEVVKGGQPKVTEESLERFESGETRCLINCMVLTEGFDCLDEQTEILAADGWKGIDEAQAGELCWSVNPQSGRNELVEIEAVGSRDLRKDEQMYSLENQHLDLMVTGGHRIYYKYRDPNKSGDLEDRLSNSFQVRTAKEMSQKRGEWALPLTGLAADVQEASISDNDLRLLGWMQTDGHTNGSYVELYQSENPKKQLPAIYDLLNNLGYSYREDRKEAADQTGFQTDHGSIRFHLHVDDIRHLRPWLSKTDLSIYWTLSSRQFRILWEAMMLGNGNRQYSTTGDVKEGGCCHFGHFTQADTFHRIAIIRGFTSYFKCEKTSAGNDCWRITARDRRWMTLRASDPRSHAFEQTDYNGKVWCVKNRNGTLIVRRNGKTAVVGNCPSLKTAWVRPSSKGPTMQMSGRAFRIHSDTPFKQIVQSRQTRWPFIRTATPAQQMLWQDESWRSLTVNPRLNDINANARLAIAKTEVELPKYINDRKGSKSPRRVRF